MRLWLDDTRRPPSSEWMWVRTAQDAMDAIQTCALRGLHFEEAHLDHDLGSGPTGYDVMVFIRESGHWPDRLEIHTDNPVGRNHMLFVVENAGIYGERTRSGGFTGLRGPEEQAAKRGWKKGR